jgi:hypothetical protein
MDWPPISKSPPNLPVQPNLLDYDKARAVFSWEAIRKEFGGLPNGAQPKSTSISSPGWHSVRQTRIGCLCLSRRTKRQTD